MNIIEQLSQAFAQFLSKTFSISLSDAEKYPLELNVDEQKQQFGDLSSNAAMGLAGALKRKPREIAQQIADNFKYEQIEKIEIAGPGFLNVTLSAQAFDTLSQELFVQKAAFFRSDEKPNRSINIEFISANPTGPLHFGHGRGGIIGDVRANILIQLGLRGSKRR